MANRLRDSALFRDGTFSFADASGPTWTLSAAGDFRPTAAMQPALESDDFPYTAVRDVVAADIAVLNLEAPVVESAELQAYLPPSLSRQQQAFALTLRDRHLLAAQRMGFNVFCLANNHITDASPAGVLETAALLDRHGLHHYGAGRDQADAARALRLERDGVRIAFAGYAQDENIAAGTGPGANVIDPPRMLADVERLRADADVVVLSIHDGYEFSDVPRLEFFRLCRQLAERGADVILGHHPHVPHGMECVGGCLILYSLGNFYFRMQSHRSENWTTRSFVPRLTFSGPTLCRLDIVPIALDGDDRIRAASGPARRAILAHLAELTRWLNEHDIDRLNRDFVKAHVFDVVIGAVYEAGRRDDREYLDRFLDTIVYKAPYLKCFKDVARLLRPEADFESF